jgi:hypothetical protein
MPPALSFDDCHRAIVQAIMPGQVLTEGDASRLVREYCDFYGKKYSLAEIQQSINSRIGQKWLLQWKDTYSETDGEKVYKLACFLAG